MGLQQPAVGGAEQVNDEDIVTRSPATTIVIIGVAAAVAYCTSPVRPFECVPADIVPDSVALAVGDTITLHVNFAGASCLSPDTAAALRRWRIVPGGDTTVASIDSLTGLVTALAPGETGVWAYGSETEKLFGFTPISVNP
jgi:hypothetical protein